MAPSRFAGVATALIGLVVLTGWALGVSEMRGILPGSVEMKANTAVGFICCGIALWLTAGGLRGRGRAAAVALSAVAVLIGALTLLQYALGTDIGIDELLFEDADGAQTVHPGRLAPQSAVAFVLLGLGLIVMPSRRRALRTAAQVGALVALGIALFALLGYAYGVNGFNKLPAFTPLALPSAIAFAVLSAGVACADPHGYVVRFLTSPRAGSAMMRKLIPATFISLPLLGWVRLEAEQAGFIGSEMGVASMVVVGLAIFSIGLAMTARGLNRADAVLRSRSAEATARLTAVVESSPDAILTVDREGKLTSWNPAAEKIFGYSAEEVIGTDVERLRPERHREEAGAIMAAAREGRAEADVETTRVRKDGREVAVSVSVSPLHSPEGEIVGASGILRDITERKDALNALRSAFAQTHQAKADLEASRLETIHRLTRAVEHRDDETGAHVERMSRYCGQIAARLGLSAEICALIETASPMHDVGKIAVPDAILFKPGPLTPAERDRMQLHAEAGYRILAGSGADLLEMAATIARSHHERFDGAGYPHGIRGDDIPLPGRIAAVADVYDALTSDRVYRPAMPVEKALEIMREGRGTHFDPEVLDAFLLLIEEQDSAGIEDDGEQQEIAMTSDADRGRAADGIGGR